MTIDGLLNQLDIRKQGNEQIYHNTKKLLKIYKGVMWNTERSLAEIDTECVECGYENLYDAMAFLSASNNCELDSLHLEERTQSLLFTHALVDIVNRALVRLKEYPDNGEMYFELVNKMHVLKYPYTEIEMLDTLNISRRTLYREKKEAITMLGVILWGFMLPNLLRNMAQNWHSTGTELAPFRD